MPLLQVRDIPVDVYENLSQRARAENRSIAQQTVTLLRFALNLPLERKAQRRAVLNEIAGFQLTTTAPLPDPAHFIREDRDR